MNRKRVKNWTEITKYGTEASHTVAQVKIMQCDQNEWFILILFYLKQPKQWNAKQLTTKYEQKYNNYN